MCGPSIGGDAPADEDLVAAMATARERDIRVVDFRVTDTTTSGGSGAGHLGLGRDVSNPTGGGRQERFRCYIF